MQYSKAVVNVSTVKVFSSVLRESIIVECRIIKQTSERQKNPSGSVRGVALNRNYCSNMFSMFSTRMIAVQMKDRHVRCTAMIRLDEIFYPLLRGHSHLFH